MFKEHFKYYRSRKPSPNLKNVIDIRDPQRFNVRKIDVKCSNEEWKENFGLTPWPNWKIYELSDIPGLIFIENPFTASGQQYWITKCLKEYTRKPNKLNLDPHNVLSDDETWWDICFNNTDRASQLLPKLRWATLGYHHNWDTKFYSEDSKTEMPVELSKLTRFLGRALGFPDFKAEAAIVNYYRMNSTLAGHTDHSEMNVEAPLFSISFGQTAIFLIGGLTQEDPANALYLRSGDIIVMSGKSRLRYHGVPRILLAADTPWNAVEDDLKTGNLMYEEKNWVKARSYVSEARININVRQVLKPGQLTVY